MATSATASARWTAGFSGAARSAVALGATAVTIAAGLVAFAVPAQAATPPTGSAGALDKAFGTNGLAAVTISGSTLTSITQTLVQPDGKILVAGLQPGTSNSVVVARLTPAGVLDTSFGSGKGYVKPSIGSTSTTDSAALALQPDGKILIGGSTQSGSNALAALARLNADGSSDVTFGTLGKVTTTVTGSPLVHISDLAVLSTGQIVASVWGGSSSNLTMLRYTAAGALDKTFGSSGIASVTTAGGVVEGQSVAVTSDGHLIEVGMAKVSSQNDTAIARFNANGTPDTTWPSAGNKTGAETFDLGGNGVADQANDVAIDSTGRLLVSGTISSSPTSAYVARFTAGGAQDSSFGTAGIVKTAFDGVVGNGGEVATDSAGRVLLSGGAAPTGTTTNALGIARLTGSGAADPTFGVQGAGATATGTGRESVPCPSGSGAGTAVAVQSNAQIVLAGYCNGSLEVTRLNVGNLSNLTMTTSTPTAPAGHGNIPLSSVPPGTLLGSSASVAGAPGFGTPGFGTPGFGTPGFGTPGFGTPGFGTPVTQSPLADPNLGQIPLSALTFTPSASGSPTTWAAILAGTPYDGLPLQSVTLQQVLALPAPNPLANVTIGQVDASSTNLRNVSIAAYLLGTTPTSALPAPAGGFCSYLTSQPLNCSTSSSSAIAADSLLDLELGGDSMQSYFGSTPINLVGLSLSNSPLSFLPLNDIDMSATTLGATKTTQLAHPGNFVTCTPSTTAGSCDTLASAQSAHAIQPSTSVTLKGLLTDSPSAVGTLALANLVLGIVSRQDLPIERLDSAGINAVYGASPMPTSGAAYTIGFDLGCDVAGSVSVKPALPSSFRVIPSTVTMTVGSGSTATSVPVNVANDGTITPASAPTCAGTQHVTVNLQAEPGVVLGGPLSSGVTAATSTDSLSLTNQAPVTVVDNNEPDDNANPANTATFDNLYVGHISHAGDLDYYSLPAPPAGSTLTVTLSHIPSGQDFDLLLYGPAQQLLRASPGFGTPGFGTPGFGTPGFGTPGFGTPGFGTPGFGTPGFGTAVGDTATSFDSSGQTTPPTLDNDIPRLNLPLRGFSTQRGAVDETISTKISDGDTTPFLIQVSGYNGSFSNNPYVLRVSVTPPQGLLPCAARTLTGTGTQTLQMPTAPLPASTQTLILVNQQRFGQVYGSNTPTGDNASDYIASELTKLAATVKGVVVPVDQDTNTASAFTAWDKDPCSVATANSIVSDVNALVDNLRSGLTDLRYVVIVGDDELFPMGRVQDKTASYNESGYTEDALHQQDNAESRAAKDGYLLSDNPYGDLAPQPFLDSQLYVPQLAVGRLVETPGEIGGTIDACVSSNCATNPQSAVVSGYSPFDKGASDVASTLASTLPSGSTKTLIDQTPPWTRQDAANAIAAAPHGYLNINAHYDFYRALPEAEFLSGNETDPLSTADLPADLSGGVAWTIGCHAGLNVPDIYIASPTAAEKAQLLDWPQAMLHNGARSFAGNSGYGLGDTDAIAYSERLSSYFAKNLNGTMTIGQALAFAKQQYSQLGIASVYDAKAIEEMNFFGLPMWRLGASGKSAPVTLPAPATNPSSITTSTTSATFDASQPSMAFSLGANAARGTYYVAGGQAPQVTPNEPIEPRFQLPLPQRTDGLISKGAIIEQLTSHDVAGFTPDYDTVVADNAGLNPEPNVTTSDFPSQLQQVAGYVDATGRHDSLVLVPGQFETDAPGATAGIERLFDRVTATVTSSNSTSTAAPRISSVASAIEGTSATVTVSTPDTDVTRGVALVLVGGSSPSQTAWQHVELVNDGNGHWVGTLTVPSGTVIGSYFAQLQNAAGNVAVSSNKGSDWRLNPGSAFTFTITGPNGYSGPLPDANGLYPDGTQVTITPPAGVSSYTVTLDGTSTTKSGTSTVIITGNGGHVLIASTSSGLSGSIGVPVDTVPPTFTVTAPSSGATYHRGAVVQTQFSCASNGSTQVLSCSGPSTLDTSTLGTHTFTVTATDSFGKTWTDTITYTVGDAAPTVLINASPTDPTDQTGGTVGYSVADSDDPVSSETLACSLDGQPLTCGALDANQNGTASFSGLTPSATPHTFSVTVTDPAGQSAVASFSWRVVYDTATTVPARVTPGAPLSAKVTYVDRSNPTNPVTKPLTGNFTVNFYANKNGSTSGTPICTVTSSTDGTYTCSDTNATTAAMNAGGVTAALASDLTQQPYFGSVGTNIADQAPSVGFSTTVRPTDPTDKTTASIGWTITDPDDSTFTVSCTADALTVPCGGASGNGSGTASLTGLAPRTAAHTFTITVTDPWGRSAASTLSWHVYYDTKTVAGKVVANVPLSAVVTYTDPLAPASSNQKPLVSTGDANHPGPYVVDFFAGQSPSASDTPICTATFSDSNGTYTCPSVGPTANAVFRLGVTAKVRATGLTSSSPWGQPTSTMAVPPYFISWGSAGVA